MDTMTGPSAEIMRLLQQHFILRCVEEFSIELSGLEASAQKGIITVWYKIEHTVYEDHNHLFLKKNSNGMENQRLTCTSIFIFQEVR